MRLRFLAGRISILGAAPVQGHGYILVKHIFPLFGDFWPHWTLKIIPNILLRCDKTSQMHSYIFQTIPLNFYQFDCLRLGKLEVACGDQMVTPLESLERFGRRSRMGESHALLRQLRAAAATGGTLPTGGIACFLRDCGMVLPCERVWGWKTRGRV